MQYLFLIIYLFNIIIKVNLQNLQNLNSTFYHLSNSNCFYQESKNCPQIKNSNNCPCKIIKFLKNKISQRIGIYCCNLNSETLISSLNCANFSENITDIHIRNITIETLNISEIKWKNLKSLSITDGQIKHIEGQFINETTISCLNLSNNALFELENNFIIQMNYLKILDLSHNNISHLPILNKNLTILDFSGINNIPCIDIRNIINRHNDYTQRLLFRNRKTSICSVAMDWTWFNDTQKFSIEQVLPDISEHNSKCPRGDNWQCKCTFSHVFHMPPNFLTFNTFNVDCSNNSLTELPKKLPPYTISLIVNNNKITKLDDIVTNPSYQYLLELYADHNEISSINILEGSRFAKKFDYLSLRYNKLTSIPTHILIPAEYKASNEVNGYIYLGGNEILCNCYTARYLKGWLEININDGNEVYCGNSIDRVIDLDVVKMCKLDNELTDYIYCIIAVEIILLLTIITKFLFDYWHYKTNRKLPWLSRVIPKTRFDWFFEIYL